MIANGRYLYIPYGVFWNNGQIMVPVHVLAKALGAQAETDGSGNAYITSGSGAIISGDEYYNEDDLFWLSHIINAESGNQILLGKIALGNVVLNRVNSPIFPNTIYDVLFQEGQFYDSYEGAITMDPNAESIIAAKLCLDGAVVLSNALWYNISGISCWASQNRPYITTIGNHDFYA